jgi:hypothetical protein
MPWHAGNRVRANGEFSRAARCEQAAPVTHSVKPHHVPVQDSLRISPEQPIHDIGWTVGLDEVDFAQSPSPWLEPTLRVAPKENVRVGPARRTDNVCDEPRLQNAI